MNQLLQLLSVLLGGGGAMPGEMPANLTGASNPATPANPFLQGGGMLSQGQANQGIDAGSTFGRVNQQMEGNPNDPNSNSPYSGAMTQQLNALFNSWLNPGQVGADTPGLGPFGGQYGMGGFTRGTNEDPNQNPLVGNASFFGADPRQSMAQYSNNSLAAANPFANNDAAHGNTGSPISADMLGFLAGMPQGLTGGSGGFGSGGLTAAQMGGSGGGDIMGWQGGEFNMAA